MITYRSAARKYESKEHYPIISKPLIVETSIHSMHNLLEEPIYGSYILKKKLYYRVKKSTPIPTLYLSLIHQLSYFRQLFFLTFGWD